MKRPDRERDGDAVAPQRVPDGFADVGVDALARRVVASEVLDLVSDRRVAETSDARERRHLSGDTIDVAGHLREDADDIRRSHVVVDADGDRPAVEVVPRENLDAVASD